MAPRDQLIVALDYPTRDEALRLVDALDGEVLWYKVGLELYLREGFKMVEELRRRGKQVFLDLKLHDIPNTVAGAVRSVASSGAGMLTVHAAGGPEMLDAAVEAASAGHGGAGLGVAGPGTAGAGAAIKLIAVTVLTSIDPAQLKATGIERDPADQVLLLGKMALKTGVAGLVCSPEEVSLLRGAAGPDPLLIVPGIRGEGDAAFDQRRTASATDALRRGASMLVVGRPITRAPDPLEAVRRLLREIDRHCGAPGESR